jgi:hypothetical protein
MIELVSSSVKQGVFSLKYQKQQGLVSRVRPGMFGPVSHRQRRDRTPAAPRDHKGEACREM